MNVIVSDLASDEYRGLLRELHSTRKWGGAGRSHADEVRYFAHSIGAKTLLDYGCGRGTLREALTGFDVAEYDPGVPGKDDLPLTADLVVCTDVLEHVEPDRLDAVLDHVRSLTYMGAYFVIALDASRVCLPDGRNSHLIQETERFWLDRLNKRFVLYKIERRKGLCVWMKAKG